MTFMKKILDENEKIWDLCAKTQFVQELKDGVLPYEKFKNYMIQDSVYLKHYCRIFGKLIYLSKNFSNIELCYSVISVVLGSEANFRLNCLEPFGITDKDIKNIKLLPENKAYIDFSHNIAKKGDVLEILMAVLPCMLSYNYVFKQVLPITKKSKYFDFIEMYTLKDYEDLCISWCDYINVKCENLQKEKQKILAKIFQEASYHELNFWKMAYRDK